MYTYKIAIIIIICYVFSTFGLTRYLTIEGTLHTIVNWGRKTDPYPELLLTVFKGNSWGHSGDL